MKKLACVLGIIFLCASVAFAAEDFSGKWEGKFVISADGQTQDALAVLVVKQSGNEITGTGGPSSDEQWPISNGKIDGNKVTFDVQTGGGPIIKFELSLVDGHLKGQANAEMDGRKMKADVDLQRK